MKKFKVLVSIILILFMAMTCGNIYAHSVELDPDNLITLPYIVSNGNGTVSISSSISNYTLYYQWIDMSTTAYSQVTKIESDFNEYENTFKEEKNIKKQAYENAKADYQEKYAIDSSSAETLAAETVYTNALQEYNNLIDEYNSKLKETENKIKDLTPMYVESNWIQTTDGNVNKDLSEFIGEKASVLWVKLVTSNTTVYDEGVYTMEGTKTENVSATSVSLSKKTLSLNVNDSETISATISPSSATDKSVVWTSSDESIATVQNGKITAISKGTAIITVKTVDGEYTDTCQVTVTEKETDNTTTSGRLPQTGVNPTIIFVIFAFVGVSIISYIKFKKMQ